MTSKHPITCIAISAAIALKLFAGTTDLSSRSGQLHPGRGVDIARVDGQIVLGL